ncbi:MAG: FAD-dependent oxidoreductase [Chloroflexi bacterium]|nr:FAD-dependent oxidoreductase [Chloroflexota bacterium]
MARVVILGAGFGGLAAARRLRRRLPRGHEMVVVGEDDHFTFRPSLPWVVLGLESVELIVRPLRPALERLGVDFVHDVVESIDVFRRVVHLRRRRLPYDVLLVAMGADTDRAAVPGGERYGFPLLTPDQALKARQALAGALGEPVVVLLLEGTGHLTPAYELALTLARGDFRPPTRATGRGLAGRKGGAGRRAVFRVHVVTEELKPLERCGICVSRRMERELHRAGVTLHLDARAVAVGAGGVELADGRRIQAAVTFLFTPYLGQGAVLRSPGLGDGRGLIDTDWTQRSLVSQRVFAVGDATAFPGQKTGQIAEAQAAVAADAIVALLEGRPISRFYRPQVIGLLELGGGRGLFFRHAPVWDPRADIALAGRWPHLAKVAWARYFLTRYF